MLFVQCILEQLEEVVSRLVMEGVRYLASICVNFRQIFHLLLADVHLIVNHIWWMLPCILGGQSYSISCEHSSLLI